MRDLNYDIKSIAVDLMRVADSLERHNQLQAAILAERRAARALKLFEMVDAPIVDIHELDGAGRAADRLTAAALDEEDEG